MKNFWEKRDLILLAAAVKKQIEPNSKKQTDADKEVKINWVKIAQELLKTELVKNSQQINVVVDFSVFTVNDRHTSYKKME